MPEQRVVGKVIINLRADKSIDCEFEGQIDHWDLSRMRPQLDQDFQLKYVHAIREDELARREENAKLAAKRRVEDQLAKDKLAVDRKEAALEKEKKRVEAETERLGLEKEKTLEENKVKEAKRRESLGIEGELGVGLAMAKEADDKAAEEATVVENNTEAAEDTPEVPVESDNVVTETEETNEEG